MNTLSPKIEPRHLRLRAIVYVRQSTPRQVQHNQESTRRQYQLAVAMSMNFGPLVLTNSGPPSGVQSAEPGRGRAHQVSVGSLSFPS
jgi:hypothetical protein